MASRIGLLSDVHATQAPVEEALSIFQREGVDRVICVGDIAGYGVELDQTVSLLVGSGCDAIMGNHDLWFLDSTSPQTYSDQANDQTSDQTRRYLQDLPAFLELEIEGRYIYVVHASPPVSDMIGIKLLDAEGKMIMAEKNRWTEYIAGFDYDALIVGHTHQVFAEQLGNTLVINPGSTKFNHSCGILSLPSMEYQVFSLSGKQTSPVWNWGTHQIITDS